MERLQTVKFESKVYKQADPHLTPFPNLHIHTNKEELLERDKIYNLSIRLLRNHSQTQLNFLSPLSNHTESFRQKNFFIHLILAQFFFKDKTTLDPVDLFQAKQPNQQRTKETNLDNFFLLSSIFLNHLIALSLLLLSLLLCTYIQHKLKYIYYIF